MSAGVTLPKGVFSHGFVNAADGRKMSKSYNNAIDPHEVGRLYCALQHVHYCTVQYARQAILNRNKKDKKR